MLNFMRTAFLAILSAAIASIVTVYFTASIEEERADNTVGLAIEADHLELAGLHLSLSSYDDSEKRKSMAKTVEKALGLTGFESLINDLNYSNQPLELFTLEVRNETGKRISDVEVIADNGLVIFIEGTKSDTVQPQIYFSSNSAKLPILDPDGKVRLIVLTQDTFYPQNALKVLLGGRKANIEFSHPMERNYLGLTTFLARHAPLSDAIIIVVFGLFVFFVGVLIFVAVISSRAEWHAKFISEGEIAKLRRLLNYIDASKKSEQNSGKSLEPSSSD